MTTFCTANQLRRPRTMASGEAPQAERRINKEQTATEQTKEPGCLDHDDEVHEDLEWWNSSYWHHLSPVNLERVVMPTNVVGMGADNRHVFPIWKHSMH